MAEDSIDDPAYAVTGEEDFAEVKEWVLGQITEYSYPSKEEIEERGEDDIRDTFQQWKNE